MTMEPDVGVSIQAMCTLVGGGDGRLAEMANV